MEAEATWPAWSKSRERIWEKRVALPFMMVGLFPKASRRVYRACHLSTGGERPRGRQESRGTGRPGRKTLGPSRGLRPHPLSQVHSQSLSCPCLTRKHLVPAGACNGGQVLHQVLAAGGLATATAAQEDDGLVLAAHQHCPVCRLGHGIDVGCHVLPPTPLEHVHHLGQERGGEGG